MYALQPQNMGEQMKYARSTVQTMPNNEELVVW